MKRFIYLEIGNLPISDQLIISLLIYYDKRTLRSNVKINYTHICMYIRVDDCMYFNVHAIRVYTNKYVKRMHIYI